MTNVISAVAFLILLLSGVPAYASEDAGGDLTSSLIFYGEIPPGSTLTLSFANAARQRDARKQASCDRVRATFRVLGTRASTSRENSVGVESLQLLHEGLLDVSPGEVQPFEFLQASSTTETVMFQLITSKRAARCIVPSSVSVLNATGDLVSMVPVDPNIEVIVILAPSGPSGRCCDCAPICACGICD